MTRTKRGPAKQRAGVQATVERITKQSPCPEHLRVAAYKYLKTSLFPPSGTGRKVVEAKLSVEGAETLLANALDLDPIFGGDPELVVSILQKELSSASLSKLIAKASEDVARRASTYAAALPRIAAAHSFLLRADVDFRRERLSSASDSRQASAALPAVRELERTETKGPRDALDAKTLVEQADAYLALGDLDTAADKAFQACNLEPQNARGWFVRVVIALRRRNQSASAVRRHLLAATEVAEAMSAHERSAFAAADDEASNLGQRQEVLDELVPQALLNWPNGRWGQYDHPEWRRQVSELMIAQAFRKVNLGGALGESRRAFELNGLAAEWRLKLDAPELPRMPGDAPVEAPLGQLEREALAVLFSEHARYRTTFFELMRPDVAALDFKLLHLRWVLEDGGYEAHWEAWNDDLRFLQPERFERLIMRSEALYPLWLGHTLRHGGMTAAQTQLESWKVRLQAETARRISSQALDFHVLAFHHQYAESDFEGCLRTCDDAEHQIVTSSAVTGTSRHPLEPMVTVPAGSQLYWQYLRALVLVHMRAAGQPTSVPGQDLLDAAETWSKTFDATDRCFWTMSEEYEDGGGEDFLVPPYEVDLRDLSNWTTPTRDRDRPFTSFVVLAPGERGRDD